MGRKRKVPRQEGVRRPIIGFLRALGLATTHPLMVTESEIRPGIRKNKDGTDMDIMKMICFGGIPACCLSARGSGPTDRLAEESAAHSMIDFFRSFLPNPVVSEILRNPECDPLGSQFQLLIRVFKEFENAIAMNFLSINRCSQFEMTSAAVLRGKEVKKKVLMSISVSKPDITACLTEKDSLVVDRKESDHDDDVIVLDDDGEIQPSGKSSFTFEDEITILGEVENVAESQKKMRQKDAIQKEFVQKRVAEQIDRNRRRSTSYSNKEVNFGKLNRGDGPSDVFCVLPQSHYSAQFSGDDSSDSDESDSYRKKPRLDNEEKRNEIRNVLVHMTTKTQSTSKEYDDEIGEIIDEWDENDEKDRSIQCSTPDSSSSHKHRDRSLPHSSLHRNFYNGYSSYEEFLTTEKLPIQYQAKTIGVIYNEKLATSVKIHINSITKRAIEDVAVVSKLTWDHYLNNSQTDAVYDVKMRARQMLFKEIQKLCSEKCISLQVTGSTVNGCGSYNSDIDMCLCYPTVGYRGQCFDDFYCERSYSAKVLRRIDRAFKRLSSGHPLKNVIRRCELIPAKVPIIKLMLNGEFAGIDIDINVNNIAGIYNSHLIHYYSLVDARFPALSLLVKHWAMRVGVNNSPDGYLNSYTIILLVVHFLQCGVQPAILPNLQYLFPHKFDKKLPLEELLLFGNIAEQLPACPPNTWSLGELLIGFFHYYSLFDFESNAISIRSAQVFSRKKLPKETSHSPVFVEEPFDAINTARSVRTSFHMNAIKTAFRTASEVFSKEKFSINDLGVPVVSRQ